MKTTFILLPLICCSLLLMTNSLLAQPTLQTQTIKGQILDAKTQRPVNGVMVFVETSSPLLYGKSDNLGYYSIDLVPVGRHTIKTIKVGYKRFRSDNLYVSSARETFLNIELEEEVIPEMKVTQQEEKISAYNPLNESLIVSTRSFSAEQTQLYPATIEDPGRLAMSFPGVQQVTDFINDIVVRGNSPIGIQWRLEGVEIRNLNHLGRRGGSGGGISIISNNMLASSDFSSGAFSAEYGNALSGIFDMKYRIGNEEKREHSIRLGVIGIDGSSEGPIVKNRSSYLINARYSTLSLINRDNIRLAEDDSENTFYDFQINLRFKGKNNRSSTTLFGAAGFSSELIHPQINKDIIFENYYDRFRQFFYAGVGVAGITHTLNINNTSSIKTVVAYIYDRLVYKTDTLDNSYAPYVINNEDYDQPYFFLSSKYIKKINQRLIIETGVTTHYYFFKHRWDKYYAEEQNVRTVINASGNTQLLRSFVQTRFGLNRKLTLQGGVHSNYLSFTQELSLEPRLAIKLQLNNRNVLSFASGIYSKFAPNGYYLTIVPDTNGTPTAPNIGLRFMKSAHTVLGHDLLISKNLRLRTEAYYQYLWNIGVGADSSSTFSVLNTRVGYSDIKLVSEGEGFNYGVDFSLERFFSNGYLLLLNTSLYRSIYTTITGKQYPTRYDGQWASSLLASREMKFFWNSIIQIGVRAILQGGFPYTPGDAHRSGIARDLVIDESQSFSKRVADYYRADLRLAFRQDLSKFSYAIAVDIQNISNFRNDKFLVYDLKDERLLIDKQRGVLGTFNVQFFF